MTSLLAFAQALAAFLIAILLLVTIHEWGHFFAARRLGVWVKRFSIGFGPVLLRWRRPGDPTEYVLSALPLGGYVAMLDEREGPIDDPALLPRAFNRQARWRRAVIIAAGPVANLVLGVLLFWLMFLVGVPDLRPVLDAPRAETAALAAGVAAGDEVLRVDGRAVVSFGQLNWRLIEAALRGQEAVSMQVQAESGAMAERTLQLPPRLLREEINIAAALGIRPYFPPGQVELSRVQPGGPAERAGLKAGDQPVAVAGQPVAAAGQLVAAIAAHGAAYGSEPLSMTVRRGGDQLEVQVAPQQEEGHWRIGVALSERIAPEDLARYRTVERHGPLAAVGRAWEQASELTVLNLRMIARLVTGQASLENISGPVTIARIAGDSFGLGVAHFLQFLALISIGIAILNLLPVPMLDGGQLAQLAVEAVRGRPLSLATEEWLQRVGIALLAVLMCLALFNDAHHFLQ